MGPKFVIYSASAGSGKTFTLASDYISICLTGPRNAHRQILAITFTNKAAGEMKDRILKNLQKLATGDDSKGFLAFRAIVRENTGLSDETINEKSAQVLFDILHDMSGFHVITIDKFFVKLYKAFTAELLISRSKAPGVDEEYIQALAIDSLLDDVGKNPDLTKFFDNYLQQLFYEEQSVKNPIRDLQNIAKNISDENAELLFNAFQYSTYEDFNQTIEQLRNLKNTSILNIRTETDRAKEIFGKHSISIKDCSRGTLYNIFYQILSEDTIDLKKAFEKIKDLNEKLKKENFNNYFNKSAIKKFGGSLLLNLANDFKPIASTLQEEIIKVIFLENILKYSSLLVLLIDLEKKIKEVSDEENQVLLSEISTSIHQYIRKEAADFIFEKIGNRYHYIFIDEFQDTSSRQWENMIPLAIEVLAKGGTLKLIGDPKQSIYRFRNANSKQMIDLVNNQYKIKFPANPEKKVLDTNFRSAQEIVQFNNDFFSNISELFRNDEFFLKNPDSTESFIKIYEDVKQKPNSEKKGYVEIKALEKTQDNADENPTFTYVLNTLKDCIARNYQYGDIAILVRSKKDGKELADLFQQYNNNRDTSEKIPISSQDSFAIKLNPKVRVLENALRLIKNENDHLTKFQLAYDLVKLRVIDLNGQSEHQWFSQLKHEHQWFFAYLEERNLIKKSDNNTASEILKNFWHLRRIPVNELATLLVNFLFPDDRHDPFLVAFLEIVYEFVEKYRLSDINGFLEYYIHQVEDERSINTASDVNAVAIMTIHKAKGLEWPVVILPFFDYKTFTPDREIIPLEEETYFLKAALVNVTKSAPWPGNTLETLRNQFILAQIEDAVNLMYVAFTRPRNELYITIKSKPNNDEISAFIQRFITIYQQYFDLENFVYQRGKKESQMPAHYPDRQIHLSASEISMTQWREKLNIARHYSLPQVNKISMGSKLHQILSECRNLDDIKEKIQAEGLENSEKNMLQKLATFIEENEELKTVYQSSLITERAILIDGQFVIPDAIAIIEDSIRVVEYKTGKPSRAHIDQLKNYLNLLSSDGRAAEGYLIYLAENSIEMQKISA